MQKAKAATINSKKAEEELNGRDKQKHKKGAHGK